MKGVVSMKKKRISFILALLVTCTFTFGLSVRADDDNEHEYKKHEKYDDDERYEYDHDDDDDDERYEYDDDDESYKTNGEVYEKGTWNIWTRELVMEKEILPFSMSKLVNLKVVDINKELNFYVIPKDGEFLYQENSGTAFRSKSYLLQNKQNFRYTISRE